MSQYLMNLLNVGMKPQTKILSFPVSVTKSEEQDLTSEMQDLTTELNALTVRNINRIIITHINLTSVRNKKLVMA